MKIIKKQKGISALGFLFVIFLSVITVAVLIKTVPSYLENMTLKSVLEDIETDFSRKNTSQSELRSIIRKRLDINNIKSIRDLDVKIIKNPQSTTLNIDYEVRKDLFANIAVVMSFHESAEVLN